MHGWGGYCTAGLQRKLANVPGSRAGRSLDQELPISMVQSLVLLSACIGPLVLWAPGLQDGDLVHQIHCTWETPTSVPWLLLPGLD